MTIPWLTILALLPAVGAVVLIFIGRQGRQAGGACRLADHVRCLLSSSPASSRSAAACSWSSKCRGSSRSARTTRSAWTASAYPGAAGGDHHSSGDHCLVARLRSAESDRGIAGVGHRPDRRRDHGSEVRLPGVLRAGAGGPELCAVPLPGHRCVLVLRVLRGHLGPDVLPDRRLRARAAQDVRGSQVLDLRFARRVCDARLGDRLVRAVRQRRASRATC